MFHNSVRKLMFLLILATLVACTPAAAGNPGAPGEDAVVGNGDALPGGQVDDEPDSSPAPDRVSDLLEKLKAAGLSATLAGSVDQPFFTVPGITLELGGEQVQVFIYPDDASAAAEASLVAPDGGSIGTSMVSWIAAPHFFRDGERIAIYVGDDQDVLSALNRVMGPQFAGRETIPGSGEFSEPPPATLTIGDQVQSAGVGSYCWNGGGEVTVCSDMLGIPTPLEPMPVGPAFLAEFELPLAKDPMDASLTVIPVSEEDAYPSESVDWRWWPFQGGSDFRLSLSQRPTLELELDPGLYVFSLFASWEVEGSVGYGFLVEVSGS